VIRLTLVGCLLLLACGPALPLDDGFAATIPRECVTKPQCDALFTAARARVYSCDDNAKGKLRCSDANADLHQVLSLRARFDEQERLALIEKEEDELFQQQAAEAHRQRELDRLAKEEAARQQAAALALAAELEEQRLVYYQVMPLEVKKQRLLKCRQNNEEIRDDLSLRRGCDALLIDLLSVTADSSEKAVLSGWNEGLEAQIAAQRLKDAQAEEYREQQRMRPQSSSESSSGGERLQCCDGSLSPSCSCAGSHRGCCSHHGGVCGCAD
jgi:hypothetical protein